MKAHIVGSGMTSLAAAMSSRLPPTILAHAGFFIGIRGARNLSLEEASMGVHPSLSESFLRACQSAQPTTAKAATSRGLASWFGMFAFLATFLLTTAAFSGAYERGLAAYQTGRFTEALRSIRPLAESGNRSAQRLLGKMYADGSGVRKDFVTACMWLNLAAFDGQHDMESACAEILYAATPAEAVKYNLRPDSPTIINAGSGANPNCARETPDSCRRLAQYAATAQDLRLTGSRQIILTLKVNNRTASAVTVFVNSDGTLDPAGPAIGAVRIAVDDKPVGSSASFDWKGSPQPAAHSYNVLALTEISPGEHSVSLVGSLTSKPARSSVVVLSGANLAVFSSSAENMQSASLASESKTIRANGMSVPIIPLLKLDKPVHGPAAVLFSGSIRGDAGDAMLGISLDGESCPWTGDQNWTVNDMGDQAERETAVFSQGIMTADQIFSPAGVASIFPLPLQGTVVPVHYKAEANTTFISVERPHILGAGYNSEFVNRPCHTSVYRCVASARGYSFCPRTGQRSVLASAEVLIDDKSDGVLMVIAKTRPTTDHSDRGGTVYLGISIDRKDAGSVGVQEIPLASNESQRTLSASYLADVDHRLSPGHHTIDVWMYASADSIFKWMSVPKELMLLYFD